MFRKISAFSDKLTSCMSEIKYDIEQIRQRDPAAVSDIEVVLL